MGALVDPVELARLRLHASQDAAQREVLGADVAIDITAIDETNTRVKVKDIVKLLQRHDGFGMVGLVGVQSNQFPRALDVARPLREAGIQVGIGGFHVSGCLAMLPDMQTDLKAALDIGCSLFAGEAEDGRMDEVLRDAAAGTLKPIYNYLNELPALESAPTPYLPRGTLRGTFNHHASFDAGRGCPYQCSFCTIINVQGRKSRRRSPDDVEKLVRQYWAQGISRFFITDDNFARNKDWEPIFDRLIELREDHKIPVNLTIQVDTMCHKIPNFIAKAARAGVKRVYIGLENINPTNLIAAKKRQNKITEYRKMLLEWKHAGVLIYAGYILGFPGDTQKTILEDLEIIKKELPIDILEFMCLTPLPGSEDHKVLSQKGVWMDPDMNKYDLEHVVAAHPKMSSEEMWDTYKKSWAAYYTPEHQRTILRRGAALRHGHVAPAGGAVRVLGGISRREPSPVADRRLPPEVSSRPPSHISDRAGLGVLSEIRLGDRLQAPASGERLDRSCHHAAGRAPRSQPRALYGRRLDAGHRRRDRNAGNVHPQRGRARRSHPPTQDRRIDRWRQGSTRTDRKVIADPERPDRLYRHGPPSWGSNATRFTR